MTAALSLALAAHLLMQAPPPDPAGDAPPVPPAPLDVAPVDELPPTADPTEPREDTGRGDKPQKRAAAPVEPDEPDEPDTPEPDARAAPTASGMGIGVGTAVGGLLLGALPGAACGWVPILGIPIACFGAAVGAGAGGVIATVLTGGDLDGNVLLLGGAAGIAGGIAFLGAAAGTLAVLSFTQGDSNTVLTGVVLASAATFAGASLGSVAAGVLTASFPPPLRMAPPSRKKRAPPPRAPNDGDSGALDAVHHSPLRY
jgi:hypothetical protein